MIDVVPDREPRGELGHAAHVIAMEVGRHQVVDLRQAGVLRRGDDAVGIAAVAGIA